MRWALDHAVQAVLGLSAFTEDDLYEALDWAASQQQAIEDQLYQDAVRRAGETPALMLYDVTSAYLEGEHNELGAYGYNRDGKKGKPQIVIGLLTVVVKVLCRVFQAASGGAAPRLSGPA